MKREEAVRKSLELIDTSEIAMVGSNGENGYPNIKAMFKIENDGLRRIWFSTNVSSTRVSQFKRNPKACVYFVDPLERKGVMLVGEMAIHQDVESKKLFWREGFERYYPLGVGDPDYCILCFTARWGNCYHRLENVPFQVE